MTSLPAGPGGPLSLRPVDPRPAACKICGAPAPLFGVQDFNRSCVEVRGTVLPLAGAPVYYRRCEGCALLYTEAFDDWSDDAFTAHIYNADYIRVDPDFEAVRPARNAGLIARSFKGFEGSLDVLDFGGGNGRLASDLARSRFRSARTYDRFHPEHRARPSGRFNLVTCFETLEHMPDPKAGAADIAAFLADESLLVLSTLVQPPDILNQRMQWWYAGPRNGHVTLFTYKALAQLFEPLGLRVYATSTPDLHLICREVPHFARHILDGIEPVAP